MPFILSRGSMLALLARAPALPLVARGVQAGVARILDPCEAGERGVLGQGAWAGETMGTCKEASLIYIDMKEWGGGTYLSGTWTTPSWKRP